MVAQSLHSVLFEGQFDDVSIVVVSSLWLLDVLGRCGHLGNPVRDVFTTGGVSKKFLREGGRKGGRERGGREQGREREEGGREGGKEG